MTFEDDKNVREAQAIMNETKLQIFGEKIHVKRASEPSNYIWENLHHTKKRQQTWFAIVMFGLFTILFAGYNLQFQMQKTLSYYDKYEKFDCDLFHNSLGTKGYENDDLKNSNIDQQALDE